MAKKQKLPADTNKRAKSIVELATSEGEDKTSKDEISSAAAAALGRKGGLKAARQGR